MAFVPGPTTSRASGGRGPFVPVGDTNRDKMPWPPPLTRLAVGPGTKATYCPGPKGCRDKWPRMKAYSVVVRLLKLKHFRVYYNRHAYTHTSMLPEKVHWANPHAHTHKHHVGHSKHACYMLLRNVIGLKLIQPAR